ncbi:MAG: Crp/Fnr family transcriptional regulator [Spirochaetales bacterium]
MKQLPMSDILFEKYGHIIPASTIIFHEGDEGKEMYIIQDGKVKISKSAGDKDLVLAILGKGDFFGEMAIVTRVRRTATAQAVTDVHLLSFDRQGFRSMIEKNSKIAMNIIDKLCRRLQHANMQLQQIKVKNAPALIALNLLYAFEQSDSPSLPYEKNVEEISLSMEIPLAEVEHLVQQFLAEGILQKEGTQITLINPSALRNRAGVTKEE